MAIIPGGPFQMGTDDPRAIPGDAEGPVRDVEVSPFLLDRRAVSNAQFAGFVRATGYVTDAERFGWSFVFAGLLPASAGDAVIDAQVGQAPWWLGVHGAAWHAPEGPGSTVESRWRHPVVQVSWHDAQAYARWKGKRLPTEAEWEKAARGGLVGARYVWGDELLPDGRHMANIWQGRFPDHNTGEDGYLSTAPVDAFAANGYGLYNMAGNVWEWCFDAWTTGTWGGGASAPDPVMQAEGGPRVIRGGSYLCHDSYCDRYRVSARTQSTLGSTAGNLGFRCAADVPTRQR